MTLCIGIDIDVVVCAEVSRARLKEQYHMSSPKRPVSGSSSSSPMPRESHNDITETPSRSASGGGSDALNLTESPSRSQSEDASGAESSGSGSYVKPRPVTRFRADTLTAETVSPNETLLQQERLRIQRFIRKAQRQGKLDEVRMLQAQLRQMEAFALEDQWVVLD